MWILVKVADQFDVGKNELERIVVTNPDAIKINKTIRCVKFEGEGFEAHTMTPESED